MSGYGEGVLYVGYGLGEGYTGISDEWPPVISSTELV